MIDFTTNGFNTDNFNRNDLSMIDGSPARVEIGRIRDDEWRDLRELRLEALQDAPTAFVERYEISVEQPDQFWQDRVERGARSDTAATFVARTSAGDGGLVGKATCFIEDDITDHVSAHLVGVYVTPAWRGRPDVAQRLLETAIDWALQTKRADNVRLFVTDTNERAAAFYRRIGFAPTGHTIPYPNDPSLTEHELRYVGPKTR